MRSRLNCVLFGPPIHEEHAHHERLSKRTALAVFSSDALSSVAYATEEILLVLAAAVPVVGAVALWYSLPIAAGIVALLVVVAISYRQTIHAYPGGGAHYIVSRENLGELPGLTAAAALLVNYILTVAVSIAAGVAATTSAFEPLRPHTVALCVAATLLIAYADLRGLKESGTIFAVTTYVFIGGLLVLAAGLDPGQGRLHAEAVPRPGRPARLRLGRLRPHRLRPRAGGGLPRRHPRADPPLRHRGLPLVHAVAGGDGAALAQGA